MLGFGLQNCPTRRHARPCDAQVFSRSTLVDPLLRGIVSLGETNAGAKSIASPLSEKSPGSAGVVSEKETSKPMPGQQTASQTEKEPVEIKLAHSPDSDDAFMFYALATHKLATPGYKYTHILSDIQSLNEAALTETYDVTAISFAAYPTLRDKYILLDCGASFGEGYGPIVVSTKSLKPTELAGKRVGVPGLKTSAYLTLKLFEPDFEPVVMPFDKIIEAVQSNLVEAGLLIHEGQLFFPSLGLHKVVDLGIWWQEQTGLPLPLGGNAVRRALGPQLGRRIAKTIRDSVSYGLEHREEALNYAMQFARDMDTELADKFVGMYVNKWTLGYGEKGKQAVKELISRGTKAGLLSGPPTVDFLSEG
jgi:1,4-dihydroxy-6-naphthoate synthase